MGTVCAEYLAEVQICYGEWLTNGNELQKLFL